MLRSARQGRARHAAGPAAWWADAALVSLALVTVGAGFGQFGAFAALGAVARHFGQFGRGAGIAGQTGLPPTILGAGLAVVWLASLGGMPLVSLADRVGRRRMLLATCALGLALMIAAAASTDYWWFIVIFAAGRPFLSAVYSLAQVMAAERAKPADRASAIAMTAAGYGTGSGLIAVIASLATGTLGFRGVFALAAIPLIALPALGARIREPDLFAEVVRQRNARPAPAPVGGHLPELLAVAGLAAAMGLVTGPVQGFLFVYAQNVRGLPGPVLAATVVTAGLAGLAGLYAGPWLADHVGRRFAGAASLAVMAGAGVLTYAGPAWLLVVGYPLEVLAASMWVPAFGALVNELFPTRLRATAAAWQLAGGVVGAAGGLLVFGAVAAAGNRFPFAAAVVCVPILAVAAIAFRLVPETGGRALMDTAPAQASGPALAAARPGAPRRPTTAA